MNREKLESDLEELRAEIKNIEGIDPSTVGRLEQIVEDLRNAADSGTRTNDLRSSIENFEVEHSAVTGILSRITNLLSDMGI